MRVFISVFLHDKLTISFKKNETKLSWVVFSKHVNFPTDHPHIFVAVSEIPSWWTMCCYQQNFCPHHHHHHWYHTPSKLASHWTRVGPRIHFRCNFPSLAARPNPSSQFGSCRESGSWGGQRSRPGWGRGRTLAWFGRPLGGCQTWGKGGRGGSRGLNIGELWVPRRQLLGDVKIPKFKMVEIILDYMFLVWWIIFVINITRSIPRKMKQPNANMSIP